MRKTIRMIALLSVAAVLVTIFAAAATRDEITRVTLPNKAEGEMYDRNELFPLPGDGVQTPRPMGSSDGGDQASQSRPGPVGVTVNPEKVTFGGGSALVSPRGGSITTPRMQADREIQRLIRKLN